MKSRRRVAGLCQSVESCESRLLLSGTPALVANIKTGAEHSGPGGLVNVGGTLFFAANDDSTGRELWKSDGTVSGTVRVRDIRSGAANSNPSYLINVNGVLYFTADDGASGVELWKSDGTAAGTVRVLDIEAGATGSNPVNLTNVAGTLFFMAETSAYGLELWKSNGTAAGTTLIKDLVPGSNGLAPRAMVEMSGKMYFRHWETTTGDEIWKSDGTQAGTGLVRDSFPGPEGSDPRDLTSVGNTLFFNAFRPESGYELWKSDGTSSGTVLVKDIYPGAYSSYGRLYPNSSNPSDLTNVNGTLYFTANAPNKGRQVWKSDGTAGGTVVVDDVPLLGPGSLQNVAGELYFERFQNQNSIKRDIYRSDGTSAGTLRVADGSDFLATGDFLVLRSAGDEIYFSASDAVGGKELWRTDGTPGGTRRVADLRPGVADSSPSELTEVNGVLYFRADNGSSGMELWKISPQVPPTTGPTVNGPVPVVSQQRPAITWTAVETADRYEVWIKNQSTNTNPFRVVTVQTNQYLPDVDFGIGKFNVWVRAGNESGWGPWSSQYNFQINTQVTAIDPGRYLSTHLPTLSWEALPGAVRYDLWVNNKSSGANQVIRNTSIAGTSFVPGSELPLGLYEAWVRGIDASGIPGQWSRTTTFHVMPPPTITEGLNPTFDRTPTFSWQSLNGAAKYEVFVRNQITGATAVYAQNITALSYTFPADLASGPYRWWLLGVSAQNIRSFWTSPADIFVGGRTDLLTPTGSTADTTPTFTWRPVDGAERYDLWVDQVGGTTQIIRQQNIVSAEYTAEVSLPAGNYRVWVRAISIVGEIGPWSLTWNFSISSLDTEIRPHLFEDEVPEFVEKPSQPAVIEKSETEGSVSEFIWPWVTAFQPVEISGMLPKSPIQSTELDHPVFVLEF